MAFCSIVSCFTIDPKNIKDAITFAPSLHRVNIQSEIQWFLHPRNSWIVNQQQNEGKYFLTKKLQLEKWSCTSSRSSSSSFIFWNVVFSIWWIPMYLWKYTSCCWGWCFGIRFCCLYSLSFLLFIVSSGWLIYSCSFFPFFLF